MQITQQGRHSTSPSLDKSIQALQSGLDQVVDELRRYTHRLDSSLQEIPQDLNAVKHVVHQTISNQRAANSTLAELARSVRQLQSEFAWMQKTIASLLQTPVLSSELKAAREAHAREMQKLQQERDQSVSKARGVQQLSDAIQKHNEHLLQENSSLKSELQAEKAQNRSFRPKKVDYPEQPIHHEEPLSGPFNSSKLPTTMPMRHHPVGYPKDYSKPRQGY